MRLYRIVSNTLSANFFFTIDSFIAVIIPSFYVVIFIAVIYRTNPVFTIMAPLYR